MSIARIPTIRAKVARQAQLVRRLALETAAETVATEIIHGRAQPSRNLARSLGAPAALLLSVFHLTPAAAKAPEPTPAPHEIPRGENTVIYYEH